jgi:anaerobic selenocysteine-containing dehydrogenase
VQVRYWPRNLARLRRLEPDPVAELSPATAAARGIAEGDWLAIMTPRARVRGVCYFRERNIRTTSGCNQRHTFCDKFVD